MLISHSKTLLFKHNLNKQDRCSNQLNHTMKFRSGSPHCLYIFLSEILSTFCSLYTITGNKTIHNKSESYRDRSTCCIVWFHDDHTCHCQVSCDDTCSVQSGVPWSQEPDDLRPFHRLEVLQGLSDHLQGPEVLLEAVRWPRHAGI